MITQVPSLVGELTSVEQSLVGELTSQGCLCGELSNPQSTEVDITQEGEYLILG